MNNPINTDNFLYLLDGFELETAEGIAQQIADDFRKRRVEKNITRSRIAEMSGVPLSSVARFEQKGLISFESLVRLAMALGYAPEVKNIFSSPKFNTMEELNIIRNKRGDKRAYPSKKKDNNE